MSLTTAEKRKWSPPPDPPSVAEFCRRVRVPDGPFRGERYDPTVEAPQAVAVQALDGGIRNANGQPFREITLAWCTQAGKSLSAILVPALHAVVGCSQSVVYCLPTADLLNKVWIDKLKPSIDGAGFGAWIPEHGPGSRGGRPTSLPLLSPETGQRAGSIIFISGGQGTKREAGQAGVTASVTLIDEADEYEDAHRIQLVRQRAAAFGKDALSIAASTVKKDENSVILALCEMGTASRLWYACPSCGRHQPMEWENVRYEGEDELTVAETARIACTHCGTLHDEAGRRRMLANYRLVHRGQEVDEHGNVVGPVPRVGSFSLRCGKLDFAIGLGLPELAVEHFRATHMVEELNDHGLMRSFYRDRLSLEYTGDQMDSEVTAIDSVTPRNLARRFWRSWAEPRHDKPSPEQGRIYSRYTCPPPKEAIGAVLAADVQQNRIYWTLAAFDDNARSWHMAWGFEFGNELNDPFRPGEMHAAITRLDDAAQEYAGDLPIVRRVVDTGYAPDQLVEMLRLNRTWRGCRGVRTVAKSVPSALGGVIGYDRKWRGLGRFEIATEDARRIVHDALRINADEAGAIILAGGLKANSHYLRHLASWTLEDDGKREKWVQNQARDDWLDCACYATTVLKWHLWEQKKPKLPPRKYGNL